MKPHLSASTGTSLLRSLIPDFFWFREGHTHAGGQLRVLGAVSCAGGLVPEDLIALVNGSPAGFSLRASDYADQAFWFLPEAQRFGILLDEHVDKSSSSFTVAVCPRGTPADRVVEHSFRNLTGWEHLAPTPPVENIERVSGKGATAYNYYNNGTTDLMRFAALALRHGHALTPSSRVLDWGCGCGRLARHLLGCRVVGIDIDSDNIAWCRESLDPAAFKVVELYPPTGLAYGTFDVVIANSVLSHLRLDAAHAWLAEIRSLLAPGGIALLSYHGEFSLSGFLSRSPELVARVLEAGFDDSLPAPDLDDVVPDASTYYRQTFMTDAYARSLFGTYFTVEEQITGIVSRFQNVAVVRNNE